jgi:AcrR family transcriptional regulator
MPVQLALYNVSLYIVIPINNESLCITIGRVTQAKAGRPRDPRLDDALLEAARDVFLERGYQHASLSEVARRAGVGTPAIYRRWRTKADIAIDIVEHESRPDPIPDSGSIRDDLVSFLELRLRTWSTPLFTQIVAPVVLEASADPQTKHQIRERFIEYREPNVEARIHKAITSGDLRDDTDPGRLVDLLMGTITMPLLFAQDLPHESEAQVIVDQVLEGFIARS